MKKKQEDALRFQVREQMEREAKVRRDNFSSSMAKVYLSKKLCKALLVDGCYTAKAKKIISHYIPTAIYSLENDMHTCGGVLPRGVYNDLLSDAYQARKLFRKQKSVPRFIYLISDGEFIKIGIASNVDKRLSQLQTGNARRLVVLHVYEVDKLDGARHLEVFIHDHFSDERLVGEWFDVSSHDVKEIMDDLFENMAHVSQVI